MKYSRSTLLHAREIATERDVDLTILHVDPTYTARNSTPANLQNAVEETVGPIPGARYVTSMGSLLEETILEEVTAENPDIVVIGKGGGRVRRFLRRLISGTPDIEGYLRNRLDCDVVTVPTQPT